MTSAFSLPSRLSGLRSDIHRNGLRLMAAIVLTIMVGPLSHAQQTPPQAPSPAPAQTPPPAQAQTPQEPEEKVIGGYVTHQSLELGGHIVEQSGSGAMYSTLVNIHTGPRILSQSLTMRAKDLSHAPFFDNLSTSSFGYGGDPIAVTVLNVSKGRIYDFRGSFHRNRQYFDYNLLANPLIPPTSNPFVPSLSSPHLFNTLRQVTDLNLTLAPLSHFSARFGYNHNINQGPSYSSVHEGTDALLLQNWRNSTDTWTGGVDWKPNPKTTFSYDEFITYYKGDTSWQLAGLNYALSNGTPVSLGVNLSSVWGTPCSSPFNSNGTVNPTCNAYLAYQRNAPIRTLFPTEQLRFQISSVPKLTMNGRVLYNGTTSNGPNYYELFNGFSSRSTLRQSITTGSTQAKRINVNGDVGATWQFSPKFSLSDVYDFWYFRQSGTNLFTETDYTGASMLVPPSKPTSTTTPDYQLLNQETHTNTITAAWDATSRARISLGYRYRSRTITQLAGEIPIHENWGLFGAALRPTPHLRVNFNFDGMYADRAFTRISPRQLQHYIVRSTYQPRPWLTFSGSANILESRNNVSTVNHLEHNRSFSFGATIAPGEKWSLDMSYGYSDVFSSTILCYASTPPPPTATPGPPVCVSSNTPYQSTGYYNQPTQFGSFGIVSTPVKRFHLNAGYRISAVNGSTDTINIRQVPGSLVSYFQTPYAGVSWDLERQWTWKADYNLYGYGEGLPVGPTLPRNFHGNIVTLSVHYAF